MFIQRVWGPPGISGPTPTNLRTYNLNFKAVNSHEASTWYEAYTVKNSISMWEMNEMNGQKDGGGGSIWSINISLLLQLETKPKGKDTAHIHN